MQLPKIEKTKFLSRREKPRLVHVLAGVLILMFSYVFLFSHIHRFLLDAVVQLLSIWQVSVANSWTPRASAIVLSMPNGTEFLAVMTWENSGLLSIMIFGLLFVFLTFPLRGALWCKVAWLLFGNFIGLVWNLVRWPLILMAAYTFGPSAFNILNYLTGPVLDFLWIVPVWSLGLSVLVSVEKRSGKME